MTYCIYYRGQLIGHSELERSSGIVHSLSGRFSPTKAFRDVEEALRPYGPAITEIAFSDGEAVVRWKTRGGEPLPAMELEIRDEEGNPVPADAPRIAWPGDFPGWRELYVLATMPIPRGMEGEFFRRGVDEE